MGATNPLWAILMVVGMGSAQESSFRKALDDGVGTVDFEQVASKPLIRWMGAVKMDLERLDARQKMLSASNEYWESKQRDWYINVCDGEVDCQQMYTDFKQILDELEQCEVDGEHEYTKEFVFKNAEQILKNVKELQQETIPDRAMNLIKATIIRVDVMDHVVPDVSGLPCKARHDSAAKKPLLHPSVSHHPHHAGVSQGPMTYHYKAEDVDTSGMPTASASFSESSSFSEETTNDTTGWDDPIEKQPQPSSGNYWIIPVVLIGLFAAFMAASSSSSKGSYISSQMRKRHLGGLPS